MEKIIKDKQKLNYKLQHIHSLFDSDYSPGMYIDKLAKQSSCYTNQEIREVITEFIILTRVQADTHNEYVRNMEKIIKELYVSNINICDHLIRREPFKIKVIRYFKSIPLHFRVLSTSVLVSSALIAYAINPDIFTELSKLADVIIHFISPLF